MGNHPRSIFSFPLEANSIEKKKNPWIFIRRPRRRRRRKTGCWQVGKKALTSNFLSPVFFPWFFLQNNMGTEKGLAVFSLALDSSSPVAKEEERRRRRKFEFLCGKKRNWEGVVLLLRRMGENIFGCGCSWGGVSSTLKKASWIFLLSPQF